MWDKVEFYRQISNNSTANKRYLSDKTNYPYARRVKIAHQLILRIDRLIDDNIITPQTTSLLASQLDISTPIQWYLAMVLYRLRVLHLTIMVIKQVNKKQVVVYVNTIAYLYGSRPYETLNKTSSATLVVEQLLLMML
jgi:hypothetical protein